MTKDLASQAVRGVAWTGLGQILRQLIQVAGSITLARLLAPDDFGVIGMAMFFVGIGQLLADFGIGSAMVQARTDDRVVFSSCFWLNLAVGGILTLAIVFASPLIADFYHRADLAPVVAALSVTLLLSGLLVVPTALLYKDMKFAGLAKAQVMGSLAGAVVAIGMAWWGAGVWALVAQATTGNLVTLAFCLASTRWFPSFEFSWSSVAPLARFSTALLGTNLIGYANRNADSALIGRFLGAGPLGIYSMAIQLMLYPLQQVSSVVVRVLFPTLVQIQDNPVRLRSAYLKAIAGIAFITFPMMGGLFAVADDFVFVVFGPNWAELAPLLKVLAWTGMMQSIGTTLGTIYLSLGKPAIAFRVTVVATPVLIGGMAVGLPWGILGVATGYSIASLGLFYYAAIVAFKLIELPLKDFHKIIVRPLLSTLSMVMLVFILHNSLLDLDRLMRFCFEVLAGGVSYTVLSFIFNMSQVREMTSILKNLRSKKSSSN